MRLSFLLVVCAAALGLAGTAGTAPGPAGAGAARTVDRTFSCKAAALAPGLRELDALAIPAGSSWTGAPQERPSPGYLSVSSGGWKPGAELVAVRAKRWSRFGGTSAPGVFALSAGCRAARAALPLGPRGLDGPTRWGESVSCTLTGRVLVRVRATLEAPAAWQRASDVQHGAARNVVAATVALRAERGRKLLALMTLDRNGRTTIWSAPACD